MDKTAFVAEVSSNHHQDLQRCLQFVDVATNIGCSAIKFQLFKIDALFAPEILARSEEHRRSKQWLVIRTEELCNSELIDVTCAVNFQFEEFHIEEKASEIRGLFLFRRTVALWMKIDLVTGPL